LGGGRGGLEKGVADIGEKARISGVVFVSEALRRAKFKFLGRQKIIVSRKWYVFNINSFDSKLSHLNTNTSRLVNVIFFYLSRVSATIPSI